MDPVVAAALVAAVGGFATALVASRSTRRVDGVKVQLEAWPELYRTVVAERDAERERHRSELAEERAIAAGFAKRGERLEAERDHAVERADRLAVELAEYRRRYG